MGKRPGDRVVVLGRAGAEAVRRGSPWVWNRAIVRTEGSPSTGQEVRLTDEAGAPLGRGIADLDSPLAVRVWSRSERAIDGVLFRTRIERAFALRRRLFGDDGATNAYRWIHGEGDSMPGFVVDRYRTVAVVRLDGAGTSARSGELLETLVPLARAEGISSLVLKSRSRGESSKVVAAFGEIPDRPIVVQEHGVPFLVDIARGQKTGAFLDQRENRLRVGQLAKDRKTVLNLFSYAGGFSLHAARAGAVVTSVDVAARAHTTAQASFRAAGLDPSKHEFVAADAFAFLEGAKRKKRTWDLVVSDPPSFAPNERAAARALAAYRALHRACASVLAEGGVFCAASCSSHVDANSFLTTLDDGSLDRDDLRLLELHGAPADHPTRSAWPEGRYLKFAVLG